MNIAPVINPMLEGGICAFDAEGAYYVVGKDGMAVQVIVVGAMHFTPGEYIDALNELLEDRYELTQSFFMVPPGNTTEADKDVLRRGFVSLIGMKRN